MTDLARLDAPDAELIRQLTHVAFNIGECNPVGSTEQRIISTAIARLRELAELPAKHDAHLTLILSEHDKDVKDFEARIAGMREALDGLIEWCDELMPDQRPTMLLRAARAAREQGNE